MSLARFITDNSKQIIAEWEKFAQSYVPAASMMNLEERRDDIAGMLQAVALDLDTPQSKRKQTAKSKGEKDAHVDGKTAANAHGTERAATGYTPVEMVSEFRALRASVIRLWTEAHGEFSRANLEDMTRFNEAIDQLLAESIVRYAQDVERSRDLFLGVLGHDLRNPLGAIMMSASMMMMQEGPDSPHARTVSRMLNSGRRMDGMIRDLLDFTRSRLGHGIPIVRADMDLETVCRQTVDEIIAFHPRRVVHFKASGNLQGQWDGRRIAQALSNLIGNAHQHGSDESAIEVAVQGDAERVEMSIHNKGPTIPKTELREIFNPFRQLDATGPKAKDLRSAGLGLYIVQAIVLAHHGTIDVKSKRSGTTFRVRLPRAAAP